MTSPSISEVSGDDSGLEQEKFRVISGFWRRLFAFLIDCAILATGGWISGFFLFDFYVYLGGWGRLLGFSIALLYFGLLNSSLGKGQTLGQRCMRIEVINRLGGHISLSRSLLRFTILSLPWFFALPLVYYATFAWLIIGFFITGLGMALVYLFCFNRRTRQSVHDLVTGTLVVRTWPQGPVPEVYFWKPHLAIAVGLYLGLVVIFISVVQSFYPGLPALLAALKQVDTAGQFRPVGFNIQKSWDLKKGRKYTLSSLRLTLVTKERFPDLEAAAKPAREIAALVLKNYPEVLHKDLLIISFCRGYDIGIASYWRHQNVSYSPGQWQNFVKHPDQMLKEIRQQRQEKGT